MSEFRDVSLGLWQDVFASQDFFYWDLPPIDPETQRANTLRYIRERYANMDGLMALQAYASPAEDEAHRYSQGQGDDQEMGQDETGQG